MCVCARVYECERGIVCTCDRETGREGERVRERKRASERERERERWGDAGVLRERA